MAVDMANEKLIKVEEALERIKAEDIERLFYPVLDPRLRVQNSLKRKILATASTRFRERPSGKPSSPQQMPKSGPGKGEKVILVRRETSPEDVGGMYVAQGILTATGGKTSHAAVVARGWGKCCIVGAEKLDIDSAAKP